MSFLDDTAQDTSANNYSLENVEEDLFLPRRTSTPNKTAATNNKYLEMSESSVAKDPFEHFAMFLSEGMRKLSQKRARHLQIQMLQLLANAEEEEEEEKENREK
ncbi:hypothetical protein ACS0PU_002008 [Formica fusca]